MTVHGLNPIMQQLSQLSDAPGELYLTGSRYFDLTASGESDWDFFVQHSTEMWDWLEVHGYHTIGREDREENYSDKSLIAVFRCELPHNHIDVQLVTDINLKLRIQAVIESNKHRLEYNKLTKKQRGSIWQMLVEMLIRQETPA